MNSIFKALNDPTRREILSLLRQRDMTAGEIASCFNMTWPSISHHLDLLRQSGLIQSEKNGQYIYYTLNMTVVDELMQWMVQLGAKKKGGKK